MTTRVEQVRERRGWEGLEVRGYSAPRRCSLGVWGAVTGWWLQAAQKISQVLKTHNGCPPAQEIWGSGPAQTQVDSQEREGSRSPGTQGGRGSGTEPILCTSLSGVPHLPVSQHPEKWCWWGQGKRQAEREGGRAPSGPRSRSTSLRLAVLR